MTWIDWQDRDMDLEGYVAELALARKSLGAIAVTFPSTGSWTGPDDLPLTPADWENSQTDGFTYRAEVGGRPVALHLSRTGRQITWR